LAGRDESTLAQYTDSLAGQLDKFSETLRNRDIGSLMDEAKQLAYRQPEVFVVGALAAGFLIGRFLKSSSRPSSRSYAQYDSRNQDGPYGQYGEYYGQQYGGQQYGGQQYRGQQYGRSYGTDYGDYSTTEYAQSIEPQYYGQGRSQSYEQEYDRGYTRSYSQGNAPRYDQSFSQGQQGQGEQFRTEHPERFDQQRDQRFGQEFGQGETQVANRDRQDDLPPSEISKQAESKGPNSREGGDAT
jgi:hypothetical protein